MEHILVQEDRSGKQMETGARRGLQRKGGPMFPKIGKQKHACYIIHDTNLAGKGVMKAKIVSKFLGTAEVRNLRSTKLWKRIGIVNRHCFIPRGKIISFGVQNGQVTQY